MRSGDGSILELGSWHIESPLTSLRLECVGDPDHRFSRSKEQISIRGEHLRHALKDFRFCRLIEIDQNIPAENDIEFAKAVEIIQKVQLSISEATSQSLPSCLKYFMSI